MEKVILKDVGKTIYREVLDNGLEIIIIPNPPYSKKKNFYYTYGTYYGALTNDFIPLDSNKMTSFPKGIAHFLEHKMFETKEGESPFEFYAKSGSYVNAYTSYKATCYVVTGNKKSIENLEYLLTFVNEPYFTLENIKKEQGIIDEELRMYDNNPDYLAFKCLCKNLYKNLPYNTTVGGTVDSIKAITKENLYSCYNTFYKPYNMFLVVGGAVDPDLIIKTTIRTLGKYKFPKATNIKRKDYREDVKVIKAYEELKVDAKVEKLALGYKMARTNFPIKSDILLDLYLNMITSLCFGSSSKFREMTRVRKLVSRSGYYFQNLGNIITFYAEIDSLNTEVFLKELATYLKNLKIIEEDLERIKKVWISGEVIKTDYADTLVDNITDDLINYHQVITNYVELIKGMNITTMTEVIKALNFDNQALVRVKVD